MCLITLSIQKKQEFEQRQRDGEVNTHQLSVEPRVVKNSKDTEEKKNKQQQKTKVIFICLSRFLS